MSIELIRPTPAHLPELARILFQAFKGISDAHNFPLDIPDMQVATMLLGALLARPDFYGAVAVEGGTLLGFNFVQISDPVGGVGPICIDPAHQSRGLGKLLMKHVTEWSLNHHGPMVRLVQDSFNMASLSLYTSVGYTVQEPLALLQIMPAAQDDAGVRPLTLADMEACDTLCKNVYKVSRRNELAAMIEHGSAMGCIPMGRFQGAALRAYIIPGFFGYSVGQSNQDLLLTIRQSARHSPPPLQRLLMPVRNGELLRSMLQAGFRCIKTMNLMSVGPYDPPTQAWTPSIAY